MTKPFGTVSYVRALRDNLSLKLLVRSTGRAMPVYANAIDFAGQEAFAFGGYSRALIRLIEGFKDLHGGWFLDIGAHIGLVSCQVGHLFQRFETIEPSPIASHVLRANLTLALPPEVTWRVHQVAIGVEDGVETLMLPPGNHGGAFFQNGNRYSEETLARKDAFYHFDAARYRAVPIQVVAARPYLTGLIAELLDGGARRGVIKIDVEGFEQIVLDALIESLPDDVRCKIIFENHDADYDLARLAAMERVRQVQVLRRAENLSDKIRRLSPLLASYITYETHVLADELTGDARGEIVVTL